MITEEMFEEFEKSTKTGCWSYQLDSKKLFWSKKNFEIHKVEGSTPPSLSNALEYYHVDDRDKIRAAFDNCRNLGKEFRLRLRLVNSLGKTIYVESYGKALYEKEKITSVFGTCRDISSEVHLVSQKKNIEKKLLEYSSSIKQFFIVAETDPMGKITFVNDKFVEISGYNREELMGKDHRILNSDTHPKDFFKTMWSTISSGGPWSFAYKQFFARA